MNIRSFLAATLLLSAASLPSFAVTPEEAEALKAKIQSYIGAEKGVIDVVAAGDNFILRLDFSPYIAKIKDSGFSAKVDPYVVNIKPLGNGQWEVSQNGPYALSFKDNANAFDIKMANSDWTAVYDEGLGYFSDSNFQIKGLTIDQTITDASIKTETKSLTSFETLSSVSKATGADGIIDLDNTAELGPATVTSKTVLPPDLVAAGMPSFDYNATIASANQNTKMKGVRVKPILDLVAFFIAHPSEELIKQNQGQLKERLAAAIPLWDNVDAALTYNRIDVGTAMGAVGMGEMSLGVEMSGLSKQGLLREAIGFKGLTIPQGIAPPWTNDLIPTDFNLDFAFGGVDLETPATMFVKEADFNNKDPIADSEGPRYLQAFSPTNSVNIALKDGLIGAPAYSITYDGSLDVTFDGQPKGTFNIRMKGLEDVIAKVQAAAATDPMAQQAMAGLIGFKGFGKAEADGTTLWAIEIVSQNQLKINGIDLSSMVGGQPIQ